MQKYWSMGVFLIKMPYIWPEILSNYFGNHFPNFMALFEVKFKNPSREVRECSGSVVEFLTRD